MDPRAGGQTLLHTPPPHPNYLAWGPAYTMGVRGRLRPSAMVFPPGLSCSNVFTLNVCTVVPILHFLSCRVDTQRALCARGSVNPQALLSCEQKPHRYPLLGPWRPDAPEMGNTAQAPTRNLEGLGYLFIALFLYVCLWGSEVNLSCHSPGVVHLVNIKLGFCFWVMGCWPETVSKLGWSAG